MSRFINILENLTGKKVERHNTSLFRKLVNLGPIKYIKGKRRPYVSTNDLDSERKISSTYLEDRKQRKKKKEEPKSFGWVD